MLSALAKYIFGGIIGDAPDASMQCETREVNDWLLIDMPDQPLEDVDLDFDDDEDEILTALPLLMTPDASFCDMTYSEIQPSTEQKLPLDTRIATQSSLLNECLEDFQILPESLYLNHSLYYPSDFSLVVSQHFTGFNCSTTRDPEQSFFLAEDRKTNSGKIRTVTVRIEKQNPTLSDKRVNHPAAYSKPYVYHPTAFSKNYVNHRSPALPAKKELLEQIKELKPIQRAQEYEMKKCLTRSQLNRQNKNYIYESSVKTNRRRQLQRNHSGANNNRKC